MGSSQTQNSLPGKAGDFRKNTLHHTEQIQPHARLWELADDIYPHINTLKILSGLTGVQIVPPTQSSWKW